MFYLDHFYVCVYRNNSALLISTWYKSFQDDPCFYFIFWLHIICISFILQRVKKIQFYVYNGALAFKKTQHPVRFGLRGPTTTVFALRIGFHLK